MKNYVTPVRDRVPLGQKAAFGAGHLVLNLLPGALGVFMFFLLTAFGMDPFLAGLLGGLPRIFDALTDPIMGFISDNTNSKWGRRRPYIFVGAILSGILFALLWQMNPENSQSYNFWYFLIMSMVFLIGNTMFATPLVGLGYEMTSDYNERTRLMAFSQTIGQIAWMIVPWFWIIISDPNMLPISAEDVSRIASLGLSEAESAKVSLEAVQANGVRKLSIIVGVACLILGVLPAFFCKGIDSANMDNRKKITFSTLGSNMKDLFKGIAQVSKNKPFLKLCGATFLVFNGFQMVASFSFFIIVFYMYKGSYADAGNWPAWFSTVTALVTAFGVIPIVSFLANKFGKRQAFIISTALSIIGYILKWWAFDKDNPFLIFMPIPFMAFGLGGLFTLMMSMTADVCDLDELENGMPRKEGTFGAIYWWMVKLGQALALVLGGAVLKFVGFDGAAAQQSAETMTSLRLADVIIPSVTAGIAILIMWSYSLSESRAKKIKEQLIERRGEL
ncbi:MAG: MFS transporter [Flavobacteriia bacterium]|nr:MFS transporter [Flavobacteriia bacterium]OIP46156.1 MAG: MFS transporter [Flavobacteriaceae bacterium CG2_30_31_66]PIV96959.1 MAG: MFS transporter [Flavobacteriaceae bacterium CG17_big_fil_post_rev_8_21_14_2_50_31_13]PIX11277.1 MAG: MFS transporter [Flavobacteriaceae bacterium CG_4_8_14_3_um_filter_31_8]PIY15265.1 MAG: MFS transporter [Flavobacteriaceae bacterium CG_4_10_14_3_um_filter_31_253]PIZ12017.1 MAG: MFS transporter [Flavobacteriaceae bacterium CG_4_10_14_0_8_um_filter_31_99]PJC09